MATRVSLGHSGRALKLPQLEWLLFVIIQLATGLRVLAGLPALNAHLALWLIAISGALWLAAFLTWALRYLPIYWQERIDHQPG